MKTILLSAALIVAGCGPTTSPNPTPGPTPEPMGAPTPTDGAMGGGPTGSDGGSGTPRFQPPSDYPPAPADAKINKSGTGTGTDSIPASQLADEIAGITVSDDSGAGGGGGPFPNIPTKLVDADGMCKPGTELAGQKPTDVTCDWAYVCVGPNGTTSASGNKDLDTKCNPTNAAMSFGNSLNNWLQMSCFEYAYYFWCTWD